MQCSVCNQQVHRAILSGQEFICLDCSKGETVKAPAVHLKGNGWGKPDKPVVNFNRM